MPTPWPFNQPRNLAVITLWRILDREVPILLVTHDADDGGWQFLDGGEFPGVDDAAVVALEEMMNLDPTLLELADLPEGYSAWRETPDSPWQRMPSPADDE